MWLIPLLACNNPVDTGAPLDNPIGAVGIEISPTEATITTSPDAQETLQLTATILLEDGSTISGDYAEWSVSNRSAGTIDDSGLLTPSASNGGVTWVTAEYADFSAQATVVVVYTDEQTIGSPDTSAFGGTESAMESDPWLYPEDGVNIPRNTPSVHFQWADMGADAYRLRFTSRVSDVTIYTDDNGWASEGENWQIIAGTNAGGEVDVELSASVDGEVQVADLLTIGVNRMDARGAIYYWTSSTKGIKKIPYGAEESENFFSMYDLDGSCVGCHNIGPTPEYYFAYSMVPNDALTTEEGHLELTTLGDPDTLILGEEDGYNVNHKHFSPDGSLLLTIKDGVMELFDSATGAWYGDVTPYSEMVGEPGGITYAQWSPDGTQVVVTVVDYLYTDTTAYQGRIALLDYLGEGVFSDPTVLVDPAELFGDDAYNAYYPTWSPDGKWIAFNISTGDTYDDEDAALYVVAGDGGDIIELASANRAPGLTNSWPQWGPLPDDDVLWLTFASRRDYGYISTDSTPQIWVTAFDPTRIEDGDDPSWPAFWLPGQTTDENNHLPVWVD